MDFSLSSSLVGNAVSNPDKLALDLQFATDKTLTARKGPTPVFTRGSGATFVDSDNLVKWAPENLVVQSENFGTTWLANSATMSLNTIVAPDGLTTADRLNEDNSSFTHQVIQGLGSLIGGQLHTFSVFAKAASHTTFQMTFSTAAFGTNLFANFILTGLGSVGNSNGVTAKIESYPDGWYRCSITANAITGGTGGFIQIVAINNNSTAARLVSYLGTNAQVVHLWGAQLERSSTARTYIPTTTAAVYGPRFDHDPVTGVCKGLLMEESRTNNVLNSGNPTLWTFTGTNEGSLIAPDGSNGLRAGLGTAQLVTNSVSTTSATAYTISVFLKKDNTDWIRVQYNHASNANLLNAWFNLSTGTLGTVSVGTGTVTSISASIVPAGNGWYRCSVTGTTPTTGSLTETIISAASDNSLSRVAGSIYGVWGGQIELGSFPTSYIPTTTGTLTRSADVCTITGSAFSGFYNAAGGTVTTSQIVNTTSTTTNPEACRIAGTGGQLQFGTTNGTTEALRFYSVNGANIKSLRTGTRASGVPFKTAVAFGNNDLAACLDGGTVLTDTTSHTIIIGTSMIIGQTPANIQIAYIRYYKKRLPNSKLQAITV